MTNETLNLSQTLANEVFLLNEWIVKDLFPEIGLAEHATAHVTRSGVASIEMFHTSATKRMPALVDHENQCFVRIFRRFALDTFTHSRT